MNQSLFYFHFNNKIYFNFISWVAGFKCETATASSKSLC